MHRSVQLGDLALPGFENAYAIGAGTSFASPMAAGEAGGGESPARAGAISGSALEHCMLVSATKITGKRPDPNYNFGRINVYQRHQEFEL